MVFNILSGFGLVLFSVVLIRKRRFLRKQQLKSQYLVVGSKPFRTRVVEVFVFLTAYPMIFLWALHSIRVFQSWIFYEKLILQIIGVALLYLGIFIYAVALYDLGSHWKLGIQYENKDSFQQTGMYSWSRHPAYMGFYVMFLGVTLMYTSYASIPFFLLSLSSLYLLAKEEERYLISIFQEDYVYYQNQVKMFFGKTNKKHTLSKSNNETEFNEN